MHSLFLDKSGAILLGYPDTTQVAHLFVEKTAENGRALATVLKKFGFALTPEQERGRDFVQLKNGPSDLDLIFAPDGIETFEDARAKHLKVEGFPVCQIDDIIASKEAANRKKDRESLERLRAFRDYWRRQSR